MTAFVPAFPEGVLSIDVTESPRPTVSVMAKQAVHYMRQAVLAVKSAASFVGRVSRRGSSRVHRAVRRAVVRRAASRSAGGGDPDLPPGDVEPPSAATISLRSEIVDSKRQCLAGRWSR